MNNLNDRVERNEFFYYKWYSIAMVSTKELQRLLEILAAKARGHQNAKVCWKQLKTFMFCRTMAMLMMLYRCVLLLDLIPLQFGDDFQKLNCS